MTTNSNPETSFWNSKLGLFILSALFLTFIPFLYTYVQDERSKRKAEKQERVKLHIEISHRINNIVDLFSRDTLKAYHLEDIRIANFGITESIQPKKHNFRPIFNEYKNNSVLSLMYQLDLVTCENERLEANKALTESLRNIKASIEKLETTPEFRKRINFPNGKFTFEYFFPPQERKELNQKILTDLRNWQRQWE